MDQATTVKNSIRTFRLASEGIFDQATAAKNSASGLARLFDQAATAKNS
jgi:hypothetical protein